LVGVPSESDFHPNGTYTFQEFTNFFRPNDKAGANNPSPPRGAFGKDPMAIESTYDFGLIEAGGNIVIAAANPDPSDTIINILGTTKILPSGGWVGLLTNGFLGTSDKPAQEIVAVDPADPNDLRVGKIESTANDVYLLAPHSILDANPADLQAASDPADVIGVNITLTAQTGSIGTTDNFLETDLLDTV